MPTPEKQRAERLGRLAEIFVAIKLLGSGHRILGWRWRSHYGEIDLIAARGNQIIFTEVKFRAATDASAIPSPHQRARICRTAASFLQQTQRSLATPCRFDLILVCWQPAPGHPRVEHIKHAWFCAPL